jgi:hypothetical protein
MKGKIKQGHHTISDIPFFSGIPLIYLLFIQRFLFVDKEKKDILHR